MVRSLLCIPFIIYNTFNAISEFDTIMANAKTDLKNEIQKITMNHLLWSHDDHDSPEDGIHSNPKNKSKTPKSSGAGAKSRKGKPKKAEEVEQGSSEEDEEYEESTEDGDVGGGDDEGGKDNDGDGGSDGNDGNRKSPSASSLSGLEDEACSGPCCASLINEDDPRLATWHDPKALFLPHRAADIISTSVRPLLRLMERK
jgi:hypothetical protein